MTTDKSALESKIDEFIALVQSLEPFETTAHIALDFWEVVGRESTEDPLISQAALEYVAGLYLGLPDSKHSTRPPRPDDILRIKQLFQEIVTLHIFDPERISVAEDTKRETVSIAALFYFLGDRGEGYPHRLWQLFEDRYSTHDAALQAILGLTAGEISNIFQELHSELARLVTEYYSDFLRAIDEPLQVWRNWKSGKISTEEMLKLASKIRDTPSIQEKLADHNRRARNIAVVDRGRLEAKFGKNVVEAFLRRFSTSFGQVNPDFRRPTDFNWLNSSPVIKLQNGQLYVPVPQLLYEAPTRTLYFDLMQDPSYARVFEKGNGEFQEKRAIDSLTKIFGKQNVFSRLRYGEGKQYETDGLVTFDDRLLIIESKSKHLTAQARYGTYEEVVHDFALAVQSSYDQGMRAKSFIKSNASVEFFSEDGNKLVLKRERFAEIYLACVTSESYGPLIMNIDKLLSKSEDEAFPWVVCLPDMDIICDYIPNPYVFFHFLERRLKCYGRVLSANELDFVADYLTHGLYYEDELKKADFVMLNGLASRFDVDYLKTLGVKYPDSISPPPGPPEFQHLLQTIKTVNGSGHTAIMLTLLDLDQETRDKLADSIAKTTKLTMSDSKMHDFTMIFDDEDSGISFLSIESRHELRERLSSMEASRSTST